MSYFIGMGKRKKTLVIQACESLDYLSPEIYDYMGEREITKAELYKNRYKILEMMKQERPKVYGNLKYAVVE